MDVTFKDQSLDRLETDASYSAGFGGAVVKAYRKAMQHIRAATDERTLYARRSFRFEKLSGDREGQFSMRLNDQWRLITTEEIKCQPESPQRFFHPVISSATS